MGGRQFPRPVGLGTVHPLANCKGNLSGPAARRWGLSKILRAVEGSKILSGLVLSGIEGVEGQKKDLAE